jgi:hypothetical protein
MEMFSFLALAIVLVLAGGAATYAVAVLLPQSLVDRAQRHGRFFGLNPAPRRPDRGSGRRMAARAPIFGAPQSI